MSRLFSQSSVLLFLLILLVATVNATPNADEIETKRQEILARRDSQKHRLNALITHMRKQLADHSAGEVILEPKEKSDLERRLDLYVMKVDSMKKPVDDEEVELTMAREASQRKNRASSAEEIIAKRKQLSEDREQQEKQENRGEEL